MIRTFALLALAFVALTSQAVTNTALLSQAKCDFANFGHGEAMAVQADGKVLLGGSFEFINGQSRENLARLTRDGVLDESWLAEVDGWVDAIVLNGAYVYVAGEFGYVNGTNYTGVVRLNAADGSIDETWDADVDDSSVYALAVDDTYVYLGGYFDTVDGASVANLARVDKVTGAVDTNWVPAPNGYVYAIQVTSSNVYVGGSFSLLGTNSASNLARVSKENGAMDTNWLGSAYDDVNDLAVDGNMLYVGADSATFISLAVQTNFGLTRFDLNTGVMDANWNPRVVGSVYGVKVETSFVYAVGEFTRVGSALKRCVVRVDKASGIGDLTWCPDVADYACDVVLNGSDVYVAGGLTKIGTTVVSGIARLDPATGNADLGFGAYCETRAMIFATALQADGKIIVGGAFFRAGDTLRSNLARISPDGSVDQLWTPEPDLVVLDVTVDGTNIYAAGVFSVIGGRTRVGIARLSMIDGSADAEWESPLGGVPIEDGNSAKASFDVRKTTKGPSHIYNVVESVVVDETGIYIGGDFLMRRTHIQYCLAKISKVNGSLLPEFDGGIWGGYVYHLALDGNQLYVGGDFEWIGGEMRNGLARLNTTDGTADPAWDAMSDDSVDVIVVHGDYVYVSGHFSDIGGLSNTLGLVRLSKADASADPAWLPLVELRTSSSAAVRGNKKNVHLGVYDLAFSGSQVILAGDFREVRGSTNIWYLCRVNETNGTVDTSWVPTPDYHCSRLLADESALYAFGEFYTMAGASRLGFAKLFLDVPRAAEWVMATKGTYTDKVNVSWRACPGSEVYEVLRSDLPSIESAVLIAGDVATTNYDDTTAVVGAIYYYWMRGTNGLGAGAYAGPDFGWRRSRAALCGEIGDYNGDRKSDLAVFDETRALWYVYSLAGAGGILAWDFPWGAPGDMTIVGDYNNDYVSDWCVYHPATASWYAKASTGETLAWDKAWGPAGIVPVPGDYDGDGSSDLAAYVKDGGYWYIWSLTNGVITWATPWGWSAATPVPGDYDGDGKSDLAVYDSVGGNWYAWSLTRGCVIWATPWGGGGMTAVPGDFDGDGKSDLAVYNSMLGKWYVYSMTYGVLAWDVQWGMPGAVPVPGDFDGDGANDWAVYDTANGLWYIRQSSDGLILVWGFQFGYSGMKPVTSAGR